MPVVLTCLLFLLQNNYQMFMDEFHDVNVVMPDFSTNETVLVRQQVRQMFLLLQGTNAVTWISATIVLG